MHLEGLKPVLVIPLLSTLVVGLLMVYVVGAPVRAIMEGLTHFLQGMGTTNAVLLGLLLGGMMAVDMGGPVNKAAYAFSVGLLTSDTFTPMAAVMAAGMTPPLGICIATFLGRNRFTQAEQEAGKAAGVLGLSFITEGAIPVRGQGPAAGHPVDGRGLRRRRGDLDVFRLRPAGAARRRLRSRHSQRGQPPRLVRARHRRRHLGHRGGPADRQAPLYEPKPAGNC